MSYGGPDDLGMPADPWAAEAAGAEPGDADPGAVTDEPDAAPDLEEPGAETAADLLAIADIERDLQGVDTAIRRLDDGTFGTCVSCQRPIDPAVLAANPIESHCGECDPAQGRLAGL
jgi:RNA polymerase-binding transcription factor DksA